VSIASRVWVAPRVGVFPRRRFIGQIKLMWLAERSRVNSSTEAAMGSGGTAGFNRSETARNLETKTTSPGVSRPRVPSLP
jgi:hypothetical protein